MKRILGLEFIRDDGDLTIVRCPHCGTIFILELNKIDFKNKIIPSVLFSVVCKHCQETSFAFVWQEEW